MMWTLSITGLLNIETNPNSSNSTSTPDPSELKQYALDLINTDRQANGLQNVSLSTVDSGQAHAEDMLANDYFSHWDLNGYKPYMRYSLAGGKGAVDENIAYFYDSDSVSSVKDALSSLEYKMMYDDASSNWGHRDNILQPLHNKVSIGIAFDRNHVYVVQDFEDQYIKWTTLTVSNGTVAMQGTLTQPKQVISQIGIDYETTSPLTRNQLSNPPYQSSYDSGVSIGSVVPAQWKSNTGITITAQTWNQAEQDFSIKFDLSKAFAQYGAGVYTLYLWTASDNYLTTYSIWYSQ